MTEAVQMPEGGAYILPESQKVFVRLPRVDAEELELHKLTMQAEHRRFALSIASQYYIGSADETEAANSKVALARIYEAYLTE
jgi:hypothetical protein